MMMCVPQRFDLKVQDVLVLEMVQHYWSTELSNIWPKTDKVTGPKIAGSNSSIHYSYHLASKYAFIELINS